MRRSLIAIPAVALTLVSACATTMPGRPVAARGGGEPSASKPSAKSVTAKPKPADLPHHGAPKVKSPLEVDTFADNPCLALTADQATSFGVRPGEPSDSPAGPVCRWRNDKGGRIELTMVDNAPDGLSSIYQAMREYAHFEPLPDIEGQPAVAASKEDGRTTGSCRVSVGLTDRTVFDLLVQQSNDKIGPDNHPCGTTVMVASDIVLTMKSGA